MSPLETIPPLSLFGAVDDLAADYLQIANIKHRSAIQKLSLAPPVHFNGTHFVRTIFDEVAENWSRCMVALSRLPSRENWRWFDPKWEYATHNLSPEVTLERAVVGAARSQKREDWSNQVPIASGVITGGGDRRRAIDLVYRRGPAAFDFVELKIGSDNPLYAAMEIIKYGFVWLLSREYKDQLGYSGKCIIQASDVKLSVLAPYSYYDGLNLGWLANGLTGGLQTLGFERQGIRLSFAFESLPRMFVWPGAEPIVALSALDRRKRL